MKNKDIIKRFTVCAIIYLIAALASFFAGYYANPAHINASAETEESYSETVEETVWETAYVTEFDYTSAEKRR